jgi:hypothetical protein
MVRLYQKGEIHRGFFENGTCYNLGKKRHLMAWNDFENQRPIQMAI